MVPPRLLTLLIAFATGLFIGRLLFFDTLKLNPNFGYQHTAVVKREDVSTVTLPKPKSTELHHPNMFPKEKPVPYDHFVVPKIVHHTWYSNKKFNFRFHHYIGMLSAYKHIKPTKVMFWYEKVPEGEWWEKIKKEVPVIEMKYREGPTEIHGNKIKVQEHKSDIVRLEAVMEYGGIYLDLDVIVLKSFDPLLKYNTTMGYETGAGAANGLCNGVIISRPHAKFLEIWHYEYRNFKDWQWAIHSVILPAGLARKYPSLIHTEKKTLHRPNWMEINWLYKEGKLYNWTNNYAVHLWYRYHKYDHNPEDIKMLNTTMGEIFRFIYYGKKDLIPVKKENKTVLATGVKTNSTVKYTPEMFPKEPPVPYDHIVVPKIVHYAWYSSKKHNFRFHHYICMLSAYKHIKPTKVMFWHENVPEGDWWKKIKKEVPVIEMKYRKGPTEIMGNPIKVAEHQSDVVRLEAVMEYGGIYTDLDVIVLKSFDPLLKYNTTMGYETRNGSPVGLCNGIIISRPQATFLKIWYDAYKSFKDRQWGEHSVLLPAKLASKYPSLIHTEQKTMHRPNWKELNFLYKNNTLYDWSKNYAVHLWYRFHKTDHNPEDIKTLNTTMGEMFRYIYYGKKELIS